ncbi:GGDEF domain protein [Marinobacter nitratireducens]|uniref:diguanylate cyclase n=2 Tax=Marinobacter nitratireducens TaxID=1137280 RepID=A0A072NE17_9GAMM|nr:GGDEF domain protein [Marinobacter nitratireducens]
MNERLAMHRLHHPAFFPFLIGLLYYLGAFVGVHFAALESGIVILWPPNAVLLAALLSRPPRDWWPFLVVVLVAEVVADVPAFTVAQALLFGSINIAECVLAASLLRYCLKADMDWHEPKDLSLFLVTVFFIASPAAALGGASVYAFVLERDAPFLTFWRLWWVGDATGLIILTPFLHMVFNTGSWRRHLLPASSRILELLAAWGIAMLACYAVFFWDLHSESYLALTPLAVVAAPVWVAIRFGPLAGSFLTAAVALYVAFGTARGYGPFINESAEHSALLTQEFAVLFTAMVLYIASFVHQNRRKSFMLRKALAEVKELNQVLEERVQLRTQELNDANDKLRLLASTDELTGIYNRRHMRWLGEDLAKRSARNLRPFSVFLLDIDYFKSINDKYGHAMGDLCLQTFVSEVSGSLRAVDYFGRWGGEEFLIIVPDSDCVDLMRFGARLLECARNVRLPVGEDSVSITISIGVAEWSGNSFEDLVSVADNALYRAKGEGRDRVRFGAQLRRGEGGDSALPSV